jgi:hypothetical protein
MGVENRKPNRREVDHPKAAPVRDTAAAESSAGQDAEGDGQVPVTVFDRMAELKRQLAEVQAQLERQRERKNASQQRWRESHREHVREYDRERKRRSRAGK